MKLITHSDKVNLWTISYMILITALLCCRDIFDIAIDKYFFVAVGLIFSIFAGYRNLIPVIGFTLPLMCGLPGNFLLPVWCALIILHQVRYGTISCVAVSFVVLFGIWEIIIWSGYLFNYPITNYIGYVSSLLLLAILITDKSDYNYLSAIIAFLIGCCVLLICIFIIYIREPSLMVFDDGVRMGGDAYSGSGVMTLHTNANNIGLISVVAISLSFSLFYYRKLNMLQFLLAVSICFFCGLFAVSRSWAISVAICFLLYFIFQKEHKMLGYTMLFILVIGMAYFLMQNEVILQVFIDRFTGDNIETGGQRTTLFQDYNNYLIDHPINLLFGTSVQLYKEVTHLYHSTHNGLQQIWLSYGIVGFIVMMYAYVNSLKANYPAKQYMACLPMIITFLFLQTIQVLNPHNGLYPILISFLMMKMIKKEKSNLFLVN